MRLAFKKYKALQNQANIGVSLLEKKHKKTIVDPSDHFIRVHAPENFSFIDNSAGMVDFISQLKELFDQEKEVFVVLKKAKFISYDAIVVLLSIMVRFKAKKIRFNGDFPKNEQARRTLIESKFFDYLYENFRDEDRYLLGQKSSIVTHAWKDVDPELGNALIKNASKTIWGQERRCPGVQRTLIELMLNTNNHADNSGMREKHWWLSVHHDKVNKKVSFSFIDFGVGIFTSLQNKRSGNILFGIFDKLREIVNFRDNAELLRLIMDGTLHKTATGKSYHGKGLPSINKVRERNQISNLNIITNDVHATLDTDTFRLMPKSFSGTFVYWELTIQNHSHYGTD